MQLGFKLGERAPTTRTTSAAGHIRTCSVERGEACLGAPYSMWFVMRFFSAAAAVSGGALI